MLKSILKLEGVQGLTKNEQKEINGGFDLGNCPIGMVFCSDQFGNYVCEFGTHCGPAIVDTNK